MKRNALFLALVLAACGGGRRPAPFPFPTYQPAPAATPEPPPVEWEPPTCQEPLGKRCNDRPGRRACDCWKEYGASPTDPGATFLPGFGLCSSWKWRTCRPGTDEPLPEDEEPGPQPPPVAPSPVPPKPSPCVETPHHPCPTQASRSMPPCVVTTTIDELRGEQLQHACGPGIESVSITGDRSRIVYALTYSADWQGRAFAETEAHKQASEAARTSCSILLALYPARACAYQVRDGAGHPVCATEIAEDGSGSTICVSVVGEGKAL